ncbi:hypothetical protein Aperf_G00000086314 [Anoplocephala perfoliata]
MLGKRVPDTTDSHSDRALDIFRPIRTKSLPDIREIRPESLLKRFQSRIFTTLQVPGPRAFFITPIGPTQTLASQSIGCISCGQVYTASSSQEKYLTAHVSINTHFSRSHEFEDLQKPHFRQPAELLFYPQPKLPCSREDEKSPEPPKTAQQDLEFSSTSTGLTNILAAQPHDLSPSAEDITLTKDPDVITMAVPTQYDVEHQLNGHNEYPGVITQRTRSFNDLKQKFEEANTMYLPRDPTVLKERPGPIRRDRRSQSVGPLRSRPRSAIYESSSPIKRPESLRPLSLHEKVSPIKSRNGFARSYATEKRRHTQENGHKSSMPQSSLRFDGYSPTRRKLVGIDRDASPRSMNKAAGSNNWPDGIFTKTGDVYKRVNNNDISYIIPTSPDALSYPKYSDYRREQLTVDCSDYYAMRPSSPRIQERPSPCLNYSYLDHLDRPGEKPYRSVNLSEWKGIPIERKSTSCLNLSRPDAYRVKRYSVPRAGLNEEDMWKVRAQEISGGRRRIHTARGSWSPEAFYSPPRSIPGDLEETTEREVRGRIAMRGRLRDSLRQDPPLPSAPLLYFPAQDGIDESSISRAFDSNIALFEQLAVDEKNEALCTKCSGCCIHSPGARQPYPSQRLFSTRRTRTNREYQTGGERPLTKYRLERGGFDRYYGNGIVDVITSPGGRMHSRSFDPYSST